MQQHCFLGSKYRSITVASAVYSRSNDHIIHKLELELHAHCLSCRLNIPAYYSPPLIVARSQRTRAPLLT
ncbi:hypothetical protein HBH56_177860 [Parastagonospora nodorum]|nr:hypothetical protein HBH56_177860 [Parastagonospora nodorum]KAH3939570.1 hypothetical protein HBH53_232470 [Parastagonospora nodorum]KAH3957546.1 hypothetical protein HBH51_224420 [Parastagonospora nodorum]KAH3964399.1 hypothetical protein HBH52_211770 [Parastagonospora nodorum]KAH4019672.1 hypothetical protein HBI09_184200 [Parastagonospora nodorum]